MKNLLLTLGLSIALSSATWAQSSPATAGSKSAGEWPQFLGPTRNGISTETGLLEVWPADGPKKVWQAAGGVGMSGIAVSGGRAITLVQKDGQQWLLALDVRSGKQLWQTALAPEYRNGMGNGPRGTPAIAGNQIFAFTGEGILVAASATDGKILWSHNLVEELSGKPADYGMACSPLVIGSSVIVFVGAPQATLVAMDTTSGKQLWKSGDDPIGYSSPTLLNVGDQQQLVAFAGNAVLGVTPASGKISWRFPYVTDFNCNIASPIAYQGQVFISSGENHGSTLLKLTSSGDQFQVAKVWESLGARSTLRNEWQTSVLLDGHLYGFDNVGSAGPVTHLTCVNAATGERVWQKLRFGKGNLILAEGKLFISTMEGELVVVRASPQGYDEIGRATVIGTTRQAPALAGGLLYLRDDQEIVCLDVRK